MAKIVLDENKVNEYIMPNIEKVSKSIKEVISNSKHLNTILPNESSSSNIKARLQKIINKVNSTDQQVTITKQKLVEKIEKVKRIESKNKSRISDLSTSILKSATSITSSVKKTVKSKKESKLVAKILEKAKLKKEKKSSNFSSLLKTKLTSINGLLTGASVANGLGGFGLNFDNSPEAKLKRSIKKNAKDSKSIEELVLELNKMNYMTEEEQAKRSKTTNFFLGIFQPSSKITVDGNTYVFKNGKCCRIEYASGVVTRISYRDGEISRVRTRTNGTNSNIDIFGDYNVENDQYGGDQGSMTDNVDTLLEDPVVLKILKEAYPPTRKKDNYARYLKTYSSNPWQRQLDTIMLSEEQFENRYGFPKEYIENHYTLEEATQASKESSLEDYELYLRKISSTGCGYTAIINTLFKEYEGREREFEEKFGYPMYTTKADGTIDYNYEYAIIDTFTEVWKDSDEYTFDEIVNSMDNSSGEDGSISGEKTKVSTGTDNEVVEEMEKIFEDKYGINTDMERISLYDSDDSKNAKTQAISKIKSLATDAKNDDSKHIILAAGGYKLYDMDGNFKTQGTGHAMYITDVTSDGDIIVSSWGKQYIVKLEDATRIGYYTVDYK